MPETRWKLLGMVALAATVAFDVGGVYLLLTGIDPFDVDRMRVAAYLLVLGGVLALPTGFLLSPSMRERLKQLPRIDPRAMRRLRTIGTGITVLGVLAFGTGAIFLVAKIVGAGGLPSLLALGSQLAFDLVLVVIGLAMRLLAGHDGSSSKASWGSIRVRW